MIVFDKEAPGGGVDAYTFMENGKAEIRFTIYLAERSIPEKSAQVRETAHPRDTAQVRETAHPTGTAQVRETAQTGKTATAATEAPIEVEITMYDPKGREAARMRLQARELLTREAAAKKSPTGAPMTEALTTRTLLIYPQLWQSVDSPLLYRVRALILAGDETIDSREFVYPICAMSCIPGKGFFLNDRPFTLHAVRYPVTKKWRENLEQDLEILLELGANCICPDRFPRDSMFYEICLERGVIIWKLADGGDSIPLLWGGEKALVSNDRLRRRDLFYYYQAHWSNREVLHICSHGKTPRPGTTASVVVYSNQKKVALYVNGVLQEFKQSPPEFLFEDIPVKGEHTVVSAQAGECFASVTWSV